VALDFLEVEEVEDLHLLQIVRFGGTMGTRDRALLESAVAMPRATFDGVFLHDDLFGMAAAYAFHIAQNQPFMDGNKRTALVAALVFLEMNGVAIEDPNERLYQAMMDVAARRIDKPALAALFRALQRESGRWALGVEPELLAQGLEESGDEIRVSLDLATRAGAAGGAGDERGQRRAEYGVGVPGATGAHVHPLATQLHLERGAVDIELERAGTTRSHEPALAREHRPARMPAVPALWPSGDVARAEIAEREHDGLEVLALGRQLVPLGLELPHEAVLLQTLEPRGEQIRRDAGELGPEVGEAERSQEEVAYDEERPAIADHVERLRDPTDLSVSFHG
jgi:death-on-curing protein